MNVRNWSWSFFGYQTPAGNKPVNDWIQALPVDAGDELVDILLYMRIRPNNEWLPDNFKPLKDAISEVRFSTATHIYRIYGCFGPNQEQYTFLVGTEKKVNNQKDAKDLAKLRRGQIQRGEAKLHKFLIEE